MRIIVIGCGWYGCHLAKNLMDMKLDFKMMDISNSIFSGSSSRNQNRLHQGFHYPRSIITRKECLEGYNNFVKIYDYILSDVKNNIYAVSKESRLSFEEYKNIYESENYSFELIELKNVENVYKYGILVNEKRIDNKKAKCFFESILSNHLIDYKQNIIDDYDLIFDCTYGQMIKIENTYYELCLSLVYKTKNDINIIVMDGQFFSIYPYDDKDNVVITHVKYTPVIKSTNIENIKNYQFNIDSIKQKIEEDIIKYLPNFKNDFTYVSFFTSIKTKFINENDDRHLHIITNDKIHSFIGGKITGIFEMEKYVNKLLQTQHVHSLLDERIDFLTNVV